MEHNALQKVEKKRKKKGHEFSLQPPVCSVVDLLNSTKKKKQPKKNNLPIRRPYQEKVISFIVKKAQERTKSSDSQNPSIIAIELNNGSIPAAHYKK